MHNDGIINSLHYVVGPHGSMYVPHGRRDMLGAPQSADH